MDVAVGGLVLEIKGAMLVRGFGFVAAGTAAAVDGGFAVNLLEIRDSAIGDATLNYAHRAAFAEGGAGFPIRREG